MPGPQPRPPKPPVRKIAKKSTSTSRKASPGYSTAISRQQASGTMYRSRFGESNTPSTYTSRSESQKVGKNSAWYDNTRAVGRPRKATKR